MSSFQTAALEVSGFPPGCPDAKLVTDVGTGTVVMEAKGSSGAWQTIETFSEFGIQTVEVSNCPPLRISVTGDAQFQWIFKH